MMVHPSKQIGVGWNGGEDLLDSGGRILWRGYGIVLQDHQTIGFPLQEAFPNLEVAKKAADRRTRELGVAGGCATEHAIAVNEGS
jgi:hypothetical protein